MNPKSNARKNLECPNCGERDISSSNIIDEFEFGSGGDRKKLSVEVELLTCGTCNFRFTGSDAERKRHERICSHMEILNPREITSLRKIYGMTRKDFSKVTGLGQATLARWETGQLFQNKAYDNYLYLLSFDEIFSKIQTKSRGEIIDFHIYATNNLDIDDLRKNFQEFVPNERDITLASSFQL